MSTRLSVNVNKIALVRNARGENEPNILHFSEKALEFGAHGITVHPRPDGRHIRYDDVRELSAFLKNKPQEFNVEGYPNKEFMDLVIETSPDQVTLVPDPPGALTSSFGWDIKKHQAFLTDITQELRAQNIRQSLFVNPEIEHVELLSDIKADRVELYTYDYAKRPEAEIQRYQHTAEMVRDMGIGVNAGHDLNQQNLALLLKKIPFIDEVSIGHALVTEALYQGLEKTIQIYCSLLDNK